MARHARATSALARGASFIAGRWPPARQWKRQRPTPAVIHVRSVNEVSSPPGLSRGNGGLAALLLAAGCSSSGSSKPSGSASPSASALEQSHISVGALPVVDDAGLYLAQKLGYFKQEGLTVTIVPVAQSTEVIPDMLHGTIAMVGGANYVSFFEAQAKGTVQFRVIAEAVDCKANTFGVGGPPVPRHHLTRRRGDVARKYHLRY